MPLIGSSRSLGFMTRMRTWIRWEKMSALCSFIDTNESFGDSNFKVEAHPAVSSNAMASDRNHHRGRRDSGMAMRQHVGRHQHHTFVGDQKSLCVFVAIESDACATGEFTTFIDDGIADLAILPDAHIGEDHR